jgi:hypothetical protein
MAKKVPFDFVLDELAALSPWTRPMFGCTAVYAGERILLVLRDRGEDADDGVWIATTREHHATLRRELPSLRSITVFGPGETGWQVIPRSSSRFEDEVMAACAMIVERDPRIGKVPVSARRSPRGKARGNATAVKKAPARKRAR